MIISIISLSQFSPWHFRNSFAHWQGVQLVLSEQNSKTRIPISVRKKTEAKQLALKTQNHLVQSHRQYTPSFSQYLQLGSQPYKKYLCKTQRPSLCCKNSGSAKRCSARDSVLANQVLVSSIVITSSSHHNKATRFLTFKGLQDCPWNLQKFSGSLGGISEDVNFRKSADAPDAGVLVHIHQTQNLLQLLLHFLFLGSWHDATHLHGGVARPCHCHTVSDFCRHR